MKDNIIEFKLTLDDEYKMIVNTKSRYYKFLDDICYYDTDNIDVIETFYNIFYDKNGVLRDNDSMIEYNNSYASVIYETVFKNTFIKLDR